jgi:hypothetical protein
MEFSESEGDREDVSGRSGTVDRDDQPSKEWMKGYEERVR